MEPVTAQKRALGFLTRILDSGRIPNSLLFTGDPGLGKRRAAVAFAMAANCENPPAAVGEPLFGAHGPCESCPSCKKIRSASHPDVFVVERSGAFVRIGQVRALLDALGLARHSARTRVAIFPEAAALNREAANALLKAVEEPPENTLFILIAPEASGLLPTLVSRSQEIRFTPLPEGVIRRWIQEQMPGTSVQAAALAVLSRGSLERARELSEGQGLSRRDFLADALAALPQKGPSAALALAEILAADKAQAARDLEWILLWQRDLLMARAAPARLTNADRAGEILSLARSVSTDKLLADMAAVLSCERDLACYNVNPRMALESLFLQLAKMENG
ncbi:MAG: DNA polymerase III subunit delta' [Deltaproteobacteria bacterium]|nr:DNA polymerase III subunit delta' [Deltaproteobacteria bacterium]